MKKKIAFFVKKIFNKSLYEKLRFLFHLFSSPTNIISKLKNGPKQDILANEEIFHKLNFDIQQIKLLLKKNNYDYFDNRISWHYHLFSGLSSKHKEIRILEIGTYLGEFTKFLSVIFPQSKITTCDLPSNDKIFRSTYDRNTKENLDNFIHRRNININKDNVEFKEINSLNLLNNFKENYFDLIWVDGDHTNPQVSLDIFQSLRLVKINGLVICDDIIKKKNTTSDFSNEGYQTLKYLENTEKIIELFFLVKRTTTNYKEKKYISISKKISN